MLGVSSVNSNRYLNIHISVTFSVAFHFANIVRVDIVSRVYKLYNYAAFTYSAWYLQHLCYAIISLCLCRYAVTSVVLIYHSYVLPRNVQVSCIVFLHALKPFVLLFTNAIVCSLRNETIFAKWILYSI